MEKVCELEFYKAQASTLCLPKRQLWGFPGLVVNPHPFRGGDVPWGLSLGSQGPSLWLRLQVGSRGASPPPAPSPSLPAPLREPSSSGQVSFTPGEGRAGAPSALGLSSCWSLACLPLSQEKKAPPAALPPSLLSDSHMSSARTMETKLQEPEGFGEEYSGKKKSKFKSIKKFFGKRKRKETLSTSETGNLKPCQSASDVTAPQVTHMDYDSEDELEIHRSTMGSRALSHDSIFIPEPTQEPVGPVRVFSQENVSDRIRALQLKLQQNWKPGIPYPSGIPSKRVDDAGMNSEDDGLPRSPPETSLLHEILNSSTTKFSDSHKHLSSLSLAGTGSEEEEQVTLITFLYSTKGNNTQQPQSNDNRILEFPAGWRGA
nr:PREDICTED: uncharacterized protein KIAA1211-like [Anolis carolinensis]|eukprot:XP_016847441.1 PREDICTED: uncharacterized protein KIAA1211-like [Anolis carolinensis]